MKRKRVLIRIASVIAVLILTCAALWYATVLMERKASHFKLAPFFQEKEDYDVFFMGSSHVLNAFFPMELWDQYGITSYNMGAHGAPIPTDYWVLRLALEHCRPQVVVIDCKGLEDNQKTSVIYSQLHQIMDAMPFCWTKVQAVADLLNDPNYKETSDGEKREPLGLLWDFAVYHNRWEELEEGDFNRTKNRQRGAEMKAVLGTPNEFTGIGDNEVLEETTGTDYLRRMIELCQSKGIQVALTFIPFPAGEVDQRSANMMERIAEEYGIPCVNFLKEKVIRYSTDMADADSHVNLSGGQKLTDWMGQFLRDRFDLRDHRQDPEYDYWKEDYQNYLKDKLRNMRTTKTLEQYLLMLKDPYYDVVIELYDRSIYNNETYTMLLQNLGIDPDDLADNADLIAIREGKDATVCYSFKKDGMEADTVLGMLSYRIEDRDEDGPVPYYVISTDGEELFALPRSANGHTDLRVHVFEHGTARLLQHTSIVLKSQKDFGEDYIELMEIKDET